MKVTWIFFYGSVGDDWTVRMKPPGGMYADCCLSVQTRCLSADWSWSWFSFKVWLFLAEQRSARLDFFFNFFDFLPLRKFGMTEDFFRVLNLAGWALPLRIRSPLSRGESAQVERPATRTWSPGRRGLFRKVNSQILSYFWINKKTRCALLFYRSKRNSALFLFVNCLIFLFGSCWNWKLYSKFSSCALLRIHYPYE